jgi:hypothetical protein
MDLHSAAQYLKAGYRIRRAPPAWAEGEYIDGSAKAILRPESLWATDWEVITDKVVSYFPVTYEDELE